MHGPIVSGSASMRLLLLAAFVMATALIPLPAQAAGDTLGQSVELLQRFPFRPDCDGNTQEIVACQWRQRNQDDATLQRLLSSTALLEQWRASRRRVCELAATKAEGGSIHPIVWLSCETSVNAALIQQISQPLVP
ncbi:lysozyme inhibitor LprI family protein [Synechococcus sp. MW101C3]|uniref:lysozyme inhibitor LprI family protein n=1 Tax=Synechococcus sp. MW101C3 TaxID=210768 RepID=UPI0013038B38|nr:lysozyme inhibitor LprI family protein [Synechococcus sp. MW101C3]